MQNPIPVWCSICVTINSSHELELQTKKEALSINIIATNYTMKEKNPSLLKIRVVVNCN